MAVNLNAPGRRPQKPWTPELDRRHGVLVSGHSQVCAEFLDHLREHEEIVLARWVDGDLYPAREREERLLASFFGLDLDRIEREKQALLRYVRDVNAYDEDQRERVALAVAHYERTRKREVDE